MPASLNKYFAKKNQPAEPTNAMPIFIPMLSEKRSMASNTTTVNKYKMPQVVKSWASKSGMPLHSIVDLMTIANTVKPNASPNEFTSRLADQMHQKPKINAISKNEPYIMVSFFICIQKYLIRVSGCR